MAKTKDKKKKMTKRRISLGAQETVTNLTKDVEEIKAEVVKIQKHKRRVLHEVWPEILMHSVSQAESAIFRSCGAYGDGLTPKEKQELQEIRKELHSLLNRLSVIYFRLKF